MKIKIKNLIIDYDKDYGIDNKTGWSIAIDGHYITQFDKFLIIAIIKAIRFEWIVKF